MHDVPKKILSEMEVLFMAHVEDVFDFALLEPEPVEEGGDSAESTDE
jgi:ATP-dependent Lon protease